MLYNYLRVILGDNGALKDYSLANQESGATIPLALVATEDYLYVAQHYPCNNFFLQMGTVNSNVSAMSVEYWTGANSGWIPMVDIIDGTSVSDKTMARDGVVQFSPDGRYSWQLIQNTTNNNQLPTGLTTLKIENVYWMRIKVSADLSSGTTLKRLAYAFTRHQQLNNLDPDIDQFLPSFATGKTSWDDEIVTASMMVVDELKRLGLIVSRGDVLRFDDVSMATDWKTLWLIYSVCGPSYKERKEEAQKEFLAKLNSKRFTFDTDENAYLNRSEINNTVAKLVR